MTADVRSNNDSLPYLDGAEDEILNALRAADDRSSVSDELARRITDWPTRYHLSRLRRNLFVPFDIQPSMRVLEIGCGTGANLRTLGETGAHVVGVEGNIHRAKCATLRCEDLPNVVVRTGDIHSIDDLGTFDVVLLIGVLEYSTAASGGSRGPRELLGLSRSLLNDDGHLILAIENELGLKYWLSYREDHRGLPWVGLEDYHRHAGPRTWSRSALSTMLTDANFGSIEWLYPFPDYKLPTFIARHELLESANGCEVLERFVQQPVVDHSAQPAAVSDVASTFKTIVRAGLAADLSNSFLIRAGVSGASLVSNDVQAWVFSNERQSQFLTSRVIQQHGSHFTIRQTHGPTVFKPSRSGNLTNIGHREMDVIVDKPLLADLAIDAVRVEAWDQFAHIWSIYERYLTANFSIPNSDDVFDGAAIDCTLSNLVGLEDTTFIDTEWVLSEPVLRRIVFVRSLFDLGLRLIRSGVENTVTSDVGTLIEKMARAVEVDMTLGEWRSDFSVFESRFQSEATGTAITTESIRTALAMTTADLIDRISLADLLEYTAGLRTHAAGLEQHAAGLEQHAAGLERLLEDSRSNVATLAGQVADLTRRNQEFQTSTSFRIGQALLVPVRLLRLMKSSLR